MDMMVEWGQRTFCMPCMGMLTSTKQLVTLWHAVMKVAMLWSTENAYGIGLITIKLKVACGQCQGDVAFAHLESLQADHFD